MAKVKKVKWAIGGAEPEDLPEFKSNDEIGKPPKGVYRMVLRRLRDKDNKNGDSCLRIVVEIDERDKDRKKWNGYTIWETQNVTEQGKPYLKRFLTSLGVSWADFVSKTLSAPDENDDDAIVLTQIGKKKLNGKNVLWATTKDGESNDGTERLEIARWLPPKEEDDVPEEDDDDDDADDGIVDDDDADDGEDDGEAGQDEDGLRAELKSDTIANLRKRALRNDNEVDVAGVRKAELIDLIVDQEMETAEPAQDDALPDEDDLRAELADLDKDALRRRAKKAGATKTAIMQAGKKKDLINLVVDAEIPPF